MTGVPVLPEGGRLLHIGPHKTGSTTLQAAFHQNRPALLEQGVHYAGRYAQPMNAAMMAATNRRIATWAGSDVDPWDQLVEEIDATTEPRVMISSEFFCEADIAHVHSILDRLDPTRTRVVVTLRPLSRIIASQWQQYVQNQMTISYTEWLDAVFDQPGRSSVTPSFWRRHRHDALVQRWAEVAGPERVTVVVVDEDDRHMLVRTFEDMLVLSRGTLVPPDVSANRSLTFPEVEFMRAFNAEYPKRGWSEADYTLLVRLGAVRHLQERSPARNEPRVLTPQWAVERTCEVAEEIVTGIAASGVDVVGDLASLTAGPHPDAIGDNDTVATVPAEIAARFTAGLVKHLEALPPRPAPPHRNVGPLEERQRLRLETEAVISSLRRTTQELEAAPVWRDLPSGALLRLLGRRAAARLRRG